jgi:hypothetical protein
VRVRYLVQTREREQRTVDTIKGSRRVTSWSAWRTIARESDAYNARLARDAAKRANGLREYRITVRGRVVRDTDPA